MTEVRCSKCNDPIGLWDAYDGAAVVKTAYCRLCSEKTAPDNLLTLEEHKKQTRQAIHAILHNEMPKLLEKAWTGNMLYGEYVVDLGKIELTFFKKYNCEDKQK